jgi:hypothetical protein
MADSNAATFEELLQFLYLAPVGIVKFGVDGAVDLINPMASQVLMPLIPKCDLSNLYDALADLVPDLRQIVAKFSDTTGVILDRERLEVAGGSEVLVVSLAVTRVNERYIWLF